MILSNEEKKMLHSGPISLASTAAFTFLVCLSGMAQISPATILEINTQTKVTYFNDGDYSKLASDPTATKPVGAPQS